MMYRKQTRILISGGKTIRPPPPSATTTSPAFKILTGPATAAPRPSPFMGPLFQVLQEGPPFARLQRPILLPALRWFRAQGEGVHQATKSSRSLQARPGRVPAAPAADHASPPWGPALSTGRGQRPGAGHLADADFRGRPQLQLRAAQPWGLEAARLPRGRGGCPA